MQTIAKKREGDSLEVQWLRLRAFTEGGTGSVPAQGGYACHEVQSVGKKKNRKENLAEGELVHVATAASQTELQMLNARGVKNALPSDFLFGKTRGTERQVQRNHFLTL